MAAVSPSPRTLPSPADDGHTLCRPRVAKPAVEEPDAAEPARPDLWGARVSNDPGLPDRAKLSPVKQDSGLENRHRGESVIKCTPAPTPLRVTSRSTVVSVAVSTCPIPPSPMSEGRTRQIGWILRQAANTEICTSSPFASKVSCGPGRGVRPWPSGSYHRGGRPPGLLSSGPTCAHCPPIGSECARQCSPDTPRP